MPSASAEILASGRWELDLRRRELRADGQAVPLGGRAVEVLEVLANAHGKMVTKDELMQRVWPGAFVEDNTLQVHILAARKAFGRDREILLTVHGRGYRLLGDWRPVEASAPADETPSAIPSRRSAGNLPAARDKLVGRTEALGDICALMSATRLLTLTGTGGIGKTRLALEAGRQCGEAFADGAWLVELASLSDSRLVPSAVASAMTLELGGAELSAEVVADAILGRHALLLLDNCEHVIDGVAVLVERLLRVCPRLVILVTSREILQIEGEHVLRVAPLGVPPAGGDAPTDLLQHSAVRLFLARVQAAAGATPDPAELVAVGAICRQLDGIPLAIEFAAARAAVLGVELVLNLLKQRFSLLAGGRRNALPQHRALRATLDWSYDLLPENEARLLRQLSVFPAGFTAAAAAAVHDPDGDPLGVLQGISNLVDKSLVARDDTQAGRWRLLETIRAYAAEKLTAEGEFAAAARAQALFYRTIMEPSLAAESSIQGLGRYGRELDNVRASLDWAYAQPEEAETAIILTAAHVPVWLQSFMLLECGERVEQALRALAERPIADPLTRARVLTILGLALLNTAGQVARITAVVSEALSMAETLHDMDLKLRALLANWSLQFNAGDYRAARALAVRFLALGRCMSDLDVIRAGHRLLGSALHFAGDQDYARRHLEHALSAPRSAHGGRWATWLPLNHDIAAKAMLARVMAVQGHAAEATLLANESLEEALATDHRVSASYALRNSVGPIALMTGDLDGAAQAVALLGDLAGRHGPAFWGNWSACIEGQLAVMQGHPEKGIALLRSGVAARRASGWNMRTPEFLGSLAEGLAQMAAHDEALEIVGQALELAARDGQDWCVPELLRLRARLHRDILRDDAAAEDMLSQALKLARQQGARLWQWRAALDLARLFAASGRAYEAASLLTAMLAGEGERAASGEADAARHLLDELRVEIPVSSASEAAVQSGNDPCDADRWLWARCGESPG